MKSIVYVVWSGMLAMSFLSLETTTVHALGSNFEHDGKTTYCWKIPKSTRDSKLSEKDETPYFAGDACPLKLKLRLQKSTFQTSENISVDWEVAADFSKPAKIGHQRLFLVEDPTSGDPVQIIHSNVHACEYGTGCDPFRDGRKFSDKTPNQVSNFTDNTASFHANELIFPLPGEYSVLAHLILPDSMTNESRFDYAVYTRVTVEQGSVDEKDDQTHAETQEDDVSTEIVIAIIAACVLVIIMIIVAVIIVRNRNKNAEKNQQSYEGFSTPSSNPQFSLHGFPMDHASNKSSNRTSMTSTDPSSYYFSTAVSRQHYPPSSYDPVDTFDVENASNANMNYEQSGRSTASSKASYQPEYHVDADIRYQTPTVASLPQQQHIPYGCPQGCQQSATSGASSALSGKDTRTGRGHVSVQDNGNNQQGAGGSRVSIHQNGDWEI